MLLDSHVAIWWIDGSSSLGSDTKKSIEAASIVHVSSATIWELTIKSMIGKIDLPDDFEEQLWSFGFEPLSVTPAHAAGIRSFPELVRHDPFDRVLLSQSRLENLDLVTADRVLVALELPHVIDARR